MFLVVEVVLVVFLFLLVLLVAAVLVAVMVEEMNRGVDTIVVVMQGKLVKVAAVEEETTPNIQLAITEV